MNIKAFLFVIFTTSSVLFAQENVPSVIEREQQRKEGGAYFQKQSGNLGEKNVSQIQKDAAGDLGPLLKAAPPRYFTFASDTSIEYDSNARLTATGAQDSAIIAERLTLKYAREFAPQWKSTSSIRQQFFWFPSIPSQDFLGQSFDSDVSYQFKGLVPTIFDLVLDPRLYLGGGLYRYEDYNHGDQLIKAGVIRGGADHAIPFFKGKSAFFYGYAGSFEATTPSTFDKHQQQIFGGWNQTLIPRYLSAQTFYRFAYSGYINVDREDKNNLLGFSLNSRINEWVGLSAFINYTLNDSNVADYQNLATGIIINVAYRF